MSKFGIIGKINFFQNVLSSIISKLNPAIMHNVGKYFAIKKVFYLSAIEQVQGDYFEFGVYTGSSFSHAIRCANSHIKYDEGLKKIKFFGFDSFKGFGELEENDKHSFYTDINFDTSYKKVNKRIKKLIGRNRYELIDGFFEDTLKESKPKSNLARIIFIDSDTYSSAFLALNYLRPVIQVGTIIILDDYFSYKGMQDKGVYGAFKRFKESNNYITRRIFTYGMGGVVQIFVKV